MNINRWTIETRRCVKVVDLDRLMESQNVRVIQINIYNFDTGTGPAHHHY